MDLDLAKDRQRVADVRANFTELLTEVRKLRRAYIVTSRDKPVGAVVTAELGELVLALGGPDEAADILRRHRDDNAGSQ